MKYEVSRVLTMPEGVDIWNSNDSYACNQLERMKALLSRIRKGEDVILPWGYTITEHRTPIEGSWEGSWEGEE